MAAATVTLNQFTRKGWLHLWILGQESEAGLRAHLASPLLLCGRNGAGAGPDPALEGCRHSLCSPQTRLDLGSLADWCFRTPPPFPCHCCCHHLLIIGTQVPAFPSRRPVQKGKFSSWRVSQTQVSWELMQTSTPPRFKELVRKYCFDIWCFYYCCNVIISKCQRRRKKDCEVNKREKPFAAEKL